MIQLTPSPAESNWNQHQKEIAKLRAELAAAKADAAQLAEQLRKLTAYLETEIFISDDALLDAARAALDAHRARLEQAKG